MNERGIKEQIIKMISNLVIVNKLQTNEIIKRIQAIALA